MRDDAFRLPGRSCHGSPDDLQRRSAVRWSSRILVPRQWFSSPRTMRSSGLISRTNWSARDLTLRGFLSCVDATAWLQKHTPDCAILDIHLRDGVCNELA